MRSPPASAARWSSPFHTPVLLPEVLALLAGARTVLDGTLGGGGHAAALVEHGAVVTALDRDPSAIAHALRRLSDAEAAGCFRAYLGNFAELDAVPALSGERFDGILLDLGVSSHQLDDSTRGFSFRPGAPLDMRMGDAAGTDAATLLAAWGERDLERTFREYGDEPRAGRLAREIVRRRARAPLATSDDLVGAIRGALGPRTGPSDFARLFQALRIAVNDELAALTRALPMLRERVVPGGTMVVIAYHSGEDRIVKHAFREWSTACSCPPRQPVCTCGGRAAGEALTRKAVVAGGEEVARNPRARSARLRAWRRAAA